MRRGAAAGVPCQRRPGPSGPLLAYGRGEAQATRGGGRAHEARHRIGGGVSTDASKTEPEAKTNGKAPLLEADHVKLYFPIKQGVLIDRTVGHVHAVDDVSMHLNEGETMGIVGESGCGKSTLARTFVRLLEPTDGALRYRGKDITHLSRKALDPMRREVQLVFQDPVSSLNPRKRVGQIVGTPLRLHG